MKFLIIVGLSALAVLLADHPAGADVGYWPFNPYFEQSGKKRSPSQGECRNTPKIAQRRCSDGIYDQPLNAYNCWDKCRCDRGVFKCTHYGDCDAKTVTSWCRCPDGKSDADNCLGFMELCYCIPEHGMPRPGANARREDRDVGPAVKGLAELNEWDSGLVEDAVDEIED